MRLVFQRIQFEGEKPRMSSEKYQVPFQIIKEYAAKNKWTEKRNKHRTTDEQKTTEKKAEIYK
ncbi:hypothetical protein DNHGIG_31600 [Collibacillus ludicampi]|uniref:Uncharacterized protein n=1 Tax=Collibacillus ludicampi TaxID=2771369 RepID=A0AAV4LIQ2_9BACL|nr:hypothetical protein DNHGIG_31600 [Collibacillus ludicampi]